MSENLPTLHQPTTSPVLASVWAKLYEPGGLETYKAVAELFAASSFCPDTLKKNKADLVLVLALAQAIRENPIQMVQNVHVINGRVSWAASYLIGRANGSGRLRGIIDWRETGEVGADDYSVCAFATLAATGREISATVSLATAKAEGWTRRNSKYLTMCQAMLRYRAATLLVRQYFPDILLGLHEQHELVDAGIVTERDSDAVAPTRPMPQSARHADPAPASPPPASRPRADVLDATYEPVAAPDPASAAIDSSAPSLAAPPGSSAVASEGADPVDPAEHARLVQAAHAALEALPDKARRDVRTTAGLAHGQRLTDAADAVLRAVPPLAKAAAEREARRKALHHPSWTEAKPGFFAQLAEIPTGGAKVTGDDVAALCERLGRPRPSAMAPAQRDKLLGWLRTPEGRTALGLPPLEAMPAAEPADEQPVREPGDENTDGGEE